MNNRFHPKYNAHLQTYVELLLSILQNITCYTLDINDLIVTSRLNGYTTGGTIDKKKKFVRPCGQIEGQNSFLSLPLVFHKFPIGLPTFFSCVHVWLFLNHRLKLLMAVC